jgi:UDP-N-acetylglucosamine 2-epimerase (non-hydrolysing)
LVSVHYAPTEFGQQNLLKEGVAPDSILVTGNTVIDALHLEITRQQQPEALRSIDEELTRAIAADWQTRPSVLITGHRRENFGGGFLNICQALRQLGERFPELRFVYPVHLNPNVQKPVYELLAGAPNICLIDPQAYSQFVALMNASTLVLTDSGGVQEEAPGLGKPVLVMRETTERPEGVTAGTVKLVGTDTATIVAEVSELLTDSAAYARMSNAVNPYGDGKAAPRIVLDIERRLRPAAGA